MILIALAILLVFMFTSYHIVKKYKKLRSNRRRKLQLTQDHAEVRAIKKVQVIT